MEQTEKRETAKETVTHTQKPAKKMALSTLTKIAMLSAVAGVLMLFETPLWFAPPFYKLDLSELAVMIGALSMGPMAGAIIELIKILLNFVLNGTITGGVGEVGNLLVGCAFVVPAAWVYKKMHSTKGMILGMAAGIVCLVALGSVVNYFVLLPVYATVFGQPLEYFIQMGNALNPAIVDLKTFILFAVAPFNLLKGIIISALTFVIYRKLGRQLEG